MRNMGKFLKIHNECRLTPVILLDGHFTHFLAPIIIEIKEYERTRKILDKESYMK